MFPTLIFYNVIILFSTLFVYLSEKVRKKSSVFFFLSIAFLIVFLPSAFRYGIGIDYFSYVDIYENIEYEERVEIGFILLNKLLSFLGLSSDWLFIVSAFITYACFFISYPKKNKTLFHFFLFITFYFSTFNIVRSSIAMGFILVGIMSYFKHQKIFRFILFILIASLFHKTAILYVVFIPFLSRHFYSFIRKNYLVILLLVSAVFIYKEEILSMVFQSQIVLQLGYSIYLENGFYSTAAEGGTGLAVISKFLILIFPIIFTKKILRQNGDFYIFILVMIACALILIFSSQMLILGRIEELLVFSYSFAIYVICLTYNIPFKKIYLYGSITFFIILFNKSIYTGSTDYNKTCKGLRIYPYVSIFNKEDSTRVPELTSTQLQCEYYFKKNR